MGEERIMTATAGTAGTREGGRAGGVSRLSWGWGDRSSGRHRRDSGHGRH